MRYAAAAVLALAATLSPALAQSTQVDDSRPRSDPKPRWIPFALWTESLRFGFGAGMKYSRWPQPQSAIYAGGFGTTNGSFALLGAVRDFRFGESRWFLDGGITAGRYPDLRAYVDGNPAFPDERAGSNESSADNFLDGHGRDAFGSAAFKYVLKAGHARSDPVARYVLDRGMLIEGASGADPWGPWRSGVTRFGARLFYAGERFDPDLPGSDRSFNSNGIGLSIEYDNREFAPNPAHGSVQRFAIQRDFGWGDSSGAWTAWQLDLRKYVPLGSNGTFRQRVIALRLWTSDTPNGQAPYYLGSTLGGVNRLRGYTRGRFHDKAALLYSVEVRLIPDWNPFENVGWMRRLRIGWLQWVAFAEAGRVAPHWNFADLNRDLKWDAGIGVRALASTTVIRADVVVSPEEWALKIGIGQTF